MSATSGWSLREGNSDTGSAVNPLEPEPPPIAILGVPFDGLTLAGAMAQVEGLIAARQPQYLVTANVDFLVQALADVELRRIFVEARLVLCDGTPLLWASRWLGNPLPERVAGADLVPLLIRQAEQKGHRLFFLGATPESSAAAIANLQRQHPGLIIAGHYSPPFRHLLEMDHDEIVRRVRAARPDLLFVSLGCPKQEKWIAMHYRTLGVPVTVGVGATIDFLAGQVRRAPVWMRRSGTEWLFRLGQEPRRLWRRYFKDLGVFTWHLASQWVRLQGLGGKRPPSLAGRPGPERAVGLQRWAPGPRLDAACARQFGAGVSLEPGGHVLLELAGVEFIDSTGVGLLIRLQKQVRAAGGQMVLLGPSAPVRRALAFMRLSGFFDTAPDAPTARYLVATRVRERNLGPAGPPVPSGRVVWQGELTAANAEAVWQRTQAELAGTPPGSAWEIDLAAVRFMDSSGVNLMVRLKRLARQCDAHVRFLGLQPAVANVLRLARLEPALLTV